MEPYLALRAFLKTIRPITMVALGPEGVGYGARQCGLAVLTGLHRNGRVGGCNVGRIAHLVSPFMQLKSALINLRHKPHCISPI
jgi:hypothetical protein